MHPQADLVRRFWELMEARAWDEARSCLADDVVVDWPHTGERFRGADRFVAMQRAYPEGWRIRVLQLVAEGDRVAAEIEVIHGEATFFVASFATVAGGRIARATELWVTARSEAAPAWRAAYRDD